MKAQLSFEYYFALIIFVMFVSSLFLKLITFFPFYSAEIENQRLRSEAYQISELLINDVGYPGNWYEVYESELEKVKRLGLSDGGKNKTNLISMDKATAFNDLCQSSLPLGYDKVLELLDVKDGFWVLLTNDKVDSPEILIGCSPNEFSSKIRTNITRIIAFDDGSFGQLRVSVWK